MDEPAAKPLICSDMFLTVEMVVSWGANLIGASQLGLKWQNDRIKTLASSCRKLLNVLHY